MSFLLLMGFTIEKESYVIYIDPGHGGFDGGAFVCGVEEAELNLQISLQLKSIYEENGYKVLLTRDGDYDLSTDENHKKRTDIKRRVQMINESNCILYISIHQNTYTNEIYSGAQCFYNYYNGLSHSLATNIQQSIIYNLGNTTREAKSINGIYLIDNVIKPGVLVECGFMSNNKELALLQDNTYQKEISKSIYYGTLNYLNLL